MLSLKLLNGSLTSQCTVLIATSSNGVVEGSVVLACSTIGLGFPDSTASAITVESAGISRYRPSTTHSKAHTDRLWGLWLMGVSFNHW
jgi:hypothetical protein